MSVATAIQVTEFIGLCMFLAIFALRAYAAPDDGVWAAKVAATAPSALTPGYPSFQEMLKAGQDGAFAPSQWSTATPDGLVEQKDIEFCKNDDKPLTLDLFTRTGLDKPVPGIVFVHGGGWVEGAKEDMRDYTMACAQMGYVTATVNYRLSQGAPFPAQVEDAKCGVRWMRAHASELNVDADRIAVCGASAGAHIALLVAYTPDVRKFEGTGGCNDTSSRVQAVMDVYGPANLASPHFRVWDIVKHLVGDRNYADDPEAFERASPLTYVTKDVPPTLILHGSSDEIVPVEDSDQLAAKLKECGVSFLYDRVDGWPHGMDFSAALKARCMHFMKAFLDRYLPITKQSD